MKRHDWPVFPPSAAAPAAIRVCVKTPILPPRAHPARPVPHRPPAHHEAAARAARPVPAPFPAEPTQVHPISSAAPTAYGLRRSTRKPPMPSLMITLVPVSPCLRTATDWLSAHQVKTAMLPASMATRTSITALPPELVLNI